MASGFPVSSLCDRATLHGAAWWSLLLALLLTAGRPASSETLLPDTLRAEDNGHTIVLSASGNPHYIQNNVVLLPEDTLLVLPGTEFLAQGTARLQFGGVVLAQGRADSLIHFEQAPGDSQRWQGLLFPSSPGGIFDGVSKLSYIHVEDASYGVMTQRNHSEDVETSIEVERSIFSNCNLGLLMLRSTNSPNDMRVTIQNCIFDQNASTDVFILAAEAVIRNTVFIPTEGELLHWGIYINTPLFDPDVNLTYNCFSPFLDDGRPWEDNILVINPGDQVTTRIEPEPNSMRLDPQFEEGSFYQTAPGSPLIDAGDPSIMDPDLTISDIGVFWAVADPAPFAFLGDLENSEWVRGFPYVTTIPIQAYPPPVLTYDGPEGLVVSQNSRTTLEVVWPVAEQLAGEFTLELFGYNSIGDESHADTLVTTLDFQPNLPPVIESFEPCPQGDCAGAESLVLDQLIAGDSLQLALRIVDPNAARLGLMQPYRIRALLDGNLLTEILGEQELELGFQLDTNRFDLSFLFSDQLDQSELQVEVRPRYQVISGDVSGVFGTETGSVYFAGRVNVPAGESLRFDPGLRIICGGMDPDLDWMMNVEGELEFAGTAEDPVILRSLGLTSNDVDERPWFMRIGPSAGVSSIRHAEFHRFGVAIGVEHLETDEPLLIEDCLFSESRVGVLAVGTPVDIRSCRFNAPADILQLGSYGVYLASSQGSELRNNLFINPIVGVELVDSDALIANNTFALVRTPVTWPPSYLLGYGRVHVHHSSVNLRNNLFQWRSNSFSSVQTQQQFENMLGNPQRAVWLDDSSQVRSEYNWFDCLNGYLLTDTELLNVSMHVAYNDSTRLLSRITAGVGEDSLYDQSADFRLFSTSPLVDAGDPDPLWQDSFDGSTNDIGWTGGPLMLENEYTPAGDRGTGSEVLVEVPQGFRLHPAWPNPFNPDTRLRVDLERSGAIELGIYNLLGQRVAVLARDWLEAGVYTFRFDGSALASGTYIARLEQGGRRQSIRMLLLR